MSERIEKDFDATEAVAGDWLARLDRGNLSAAERASFEAWRADPRHEAIFANLQAAWQQLDLLRALCFEPEEVTHEGIDPDALDPDVPVCAPSEKHRSVRAYWVAAASVAAVAVLTILTVDLFEVRKPAARDATTAALFEAHYLTPIGGHHRTTLADGTVLELNTDTELRVILTEKERRIELLRGEATFEVAPDSQRRFFVAARGFTVRDLGTAFNVEYRDDGIEVVVIDGQVAVDSTVIRAGHLATITSAGLDVRPLSKERLERILAWKKGMLAFDDVPLSEAAREFNRYNRRRLVVDPALRNVRIGGYFRANNVEGFVRVLEEHFSVRALREPTQIRLGPK